MTIRLIGVLATIAVGCGAGGLETDGGLGAPCHSYGDCDATASADSGVALCLTAAPDGACSTSCEADEDCPGAGVCWSWSDPEGGGIIGVCVPTCDLDAPLCRAQFECTALPGREEAGCAWSALVQGTEELE